MDAAQTGGHSAGSHGKTNSADADHSGPKSDKGDEAGCGDGGDENDDQMHSDDDGAGGGGELPDEVTLQTQYVHHGLAQIIDYIENGDLPDDSRQA